jgi:hypothetical protein
MANEIQTNFSLSINNPPYKGQLVPVYGQYNQNALGVDHRIVSVPTTGLAVTFQVATFGFLFLQNLDATNYVEYNGVGRLKPGEFAWLRLKPGITFTLTANVATVSVHYFMLSD